MQENSSSKMTRGREVGGGGCEAITKVITEVSATGRGLPCLKSWLLLSVTRLLALLGYWLQLKAKDDEDLENEDSASALDT